MCAVAQRLGRGMREVTDKHMHGTECGSGLGWRAGTGEKGCVNGPATHPAHTHRCLLLCRGGTRTECGAHTTLGAGVASTSADQGSALAPAASFTNR
jgi:hypothetical protein